MIELGEPSLNYVLIIDDDVNLASSLARILSTRFSVFIANTTEIASRFIMNQEFAAIIVDYDLNSPIDGIMFSEYITMIQPLCYVIMLTGVADFRTAQRALNEGNLDKFYLKPLNPAELYNTLEFAISNYNTKKEISQMLQSIEGTDLALNLLGQLFEDNIYSNLENTELNGIVISRNSIPVYSKFLNKTYLQNFTDTLFSGFMTALHMLGQEVFSSENKLDMVKFGQMSIHFRFFEDYQFNFIVHSKNNHSDKIEDKIDNFTSQIVGYIEKNDDPFILKERNLYHAESVFSRIFE